MSTVSHIVRFERFFRVAASLDIDTTDLSRYTDFVQRKVRDLLVRSQAIAKANGRARIEPQDLPITRGLQESIQAFRRLDEDLELMPMLQPLALGPPLDLETSGEAELELAAIAGGISVALGRAFRIIDPKLRKPRSEHWERACRIFDLLL